MKTFQKIIVCTILCILLSSLRLPAQTTTPQKGFEITGRLNGLTEGQTVWLARFNSKNYHSYNDYLSWDSAFVKNGVFHFSGVVPDGPRRYWLEFKGLPGHVNFYMDNSEKITMSSDSDIHKNYGGDMAHNITIEGSPSTLGFRTVENVYSFYFQSMIKLNSYVTTVHDSIGFNGPLLDGIFKAKAELNDALRFGFLSFNPHSIPEIRKFWFNFLPAFETSGHASFWYKVYNNLPEDQKNMFHGRWLKELVDISIGQPLPEFSLPTPDGKTLALKDIVAKSKFTLVHIWSAHSLDRKQYQDEVRAMYKKYHDKGLNVIGLFHNDVFDDPDHKYDQVDNLWKGLVKDEAFPWYNVADLRGSESIVDKIYREGGTNNTTNVLLDAQGKIVAWEMKGAELQYHLWKAFGQ